MEDADAEFQADLQRVIDLSKTDTASSSSSLRQSPLPQKSAPEIPLPQPQSSHPLLIDRKKMEEERLARQKRLRPEIQHSENVPDEDEDEDEERGRYGNAKRQRLSSTISSTRRTNVPSSSKTATAEASATATSHGLFWEGEMRQTANKYVIPDKDTRPVFRLSEIFGSVSVIKLYKCSRS